MLESLTFLWPWVFFLLPLPFLVRILMPPTSPKQAASLYVPFAEDFFLADQVQSSSPSQRSGVSALIFFLGLLIWVCLVTALARPQLLGKPIALPVDGRNILLAVDISGSMQQEDFILNKQQVDRLTAVKDVAGTFIARRAGDNIALLVFGAQAYLHVPLTYDRQTVQTMLHESLIGLAGKATAIGDALGLAVKRLQQVPGEKVIILLTDGANTAGVLAPLDAADIAREEGITVYTVGIGAQRMAVSSFMGTRIINPSKDLDENLLREIATRTKGQYFRATDTAGLEKIYAMIDQLEPVMDEKQYYRPRTALFFWPLAAALIMSIVVLLYLVRKKRSVGLAGDVEV